MSRAAVERLCVEAYEAGARAMRDSIAETLRQFADPLAAEWAARDSTSTADLVRALVGSLAEMIERQRHGP